MSEQPESPAEEPVSVTAGEESHDDPTQYVGEDAEAPEDTGEPEAPAEDDGP